jgi:hypothetical protein
MPNFMSASMRDILLAHVDNNPVPIIRPADVADALGAVRAGQLFKSAAALITRGLVRYTPPIKPTHTVITEAGRVALRKVLAEYAEILVRSGYRVEELRYLAASTLVHEPREVAETEDLQEPV